MRVDRSRTRTRAESTSRAGAGAPAFDITSLPWNILLLAGGSEYSQPIWTGTASTGGNSGTEDFDGTGNAPAEGTPVNGKVPAVFDGMTTKLTGESDDEDVLGTTFSTFFLVLANDDPPDTPDGYQEANLLADVNGDIGFGYSDIGFFASVYDGEDYAMVALPASPGDWKLVQFRYNGSNLLEGRINGGAWSSVALTPPPYLAANVLSIGNGALVVSPLDGKILAVGASGDHKSDDDFNNLLTYCRTTYNLSLE